MTLPALHREATAVDVESLDAKRAATGGHEATFEQLYRRHVAQFACMVRRMAELTRPTISPRTFSSAPGTSSRPFGARAPLAWLYRLGVNVVLSKRRSGENDRTWILDDELAMASTTQATTHPATRMDLESAIAHPDGARKVFVLHDVEGWTHEEIAEQMGWSQDVEVAAVTEGAPLSEDAR